MANYGAAVRQWRESWWPLGASSIEAFEVHEVTPTLLDPGGSIWAAKHGEESQGYYRKELAYSRNNIKRRPALREEEKGGVK